MNQLSDNRRQDQLAPNCLFGIPAAEINAKKAAPDSGAAFLSVGGRALTSIA
jgi:hypothetical protein